MDHLALDVNVNTNYDHFDSLADSYSSSSYKNNWL